MFGVPGRARRQRQRQARSLLVAAALLVGGYAVADPTRDGASAAQHGATEPMGAALAPATQGAVGAPAAAQPATDPHAPTGSDGPDGLTPALARSFARARAAAAADGVRIDLVSGHRSAADQQQLFEAAVGRYGSEDAARRWVLPPEDSAHVSGEAVDVGPRAGAQWLEEHGERFGLCRRYANEWWHFERLAGELGSTCPPLVADAGS